MFVCAVLKLAYYFVRDPSSQHTNTNIFILLMASMFLNKKKIKIKTHHHEVKKELNQTGFNWFRLPFAGASNRHRA